MNGCLMMKVMAEFYSPAVCGELMYII